MADHKGNPPPYSPPQGMTQPIGFEATVPPYPHPQTTPFEGAYPGPPPPAQYAQQLPGQTVVTVSPAPTTHVLLMGGCPACRVGVVRDNFTCAGICLAIFLFPIGFICLFLLTEKQCNHCGARF